MIKRKELRRRRILVSTWRRKVGTKWLPSNRREFGMAESRFKKVADALTVGNMINDARTWDEKVTWAMELGDDTPNPLYQPEEK